MLEKRKMLIHLLVVEFSCELLELTIRWWSEMWMCVNERERNGWEGWMSQMRMMVQVEVMQQRVRMLEGITKVKRKKRKKKKDQ